MMRGTSRLRSPERAFTGRTLLRGPVGLGMTLSLVMLVAACGQEQVASPSASGSDAGSAAPTSSLTPDASGESGRGGTFVMAVGEMLPMDPLSSQTFANLQIYQAPLRRHPTEYGEFLPGYAEGVDVSDDGLEYTIHIRPGVMFHDGSPLTAEALVFTLELQAYPDNEFHNGGELWASWARGNPGVVTAIEAVDEMTVRLTLSEPVVDMEFVLADEQGGFAAVNPDVIRADPEGFGQDPAGAGTGPFMFAERSNDAVTLVRNDDYWDEGLPLLDRWILRVMPDPGARLLALKAGEIHMFDVSGPEIAQLENDPDINLLTVPPIFGSFIAFNYDDPVTGIPEVRQAISQAIDMDSIVGELSPFATVTPTFGLFPGLPGYRDDLTWYPYDPAAARDLLTSAGFPDGVDLTFTFSTPPVGLNHQLLAQALQAQLQEAGFRVTLNQIDGPTMFQSGFGPPGREDYPFQMALNLTGSDGNPVGMLAGWTSRSNYAAQHPAFMELFGRMVTTTDPDTLLEIFGEMQQTLYDDVAYVPLAHTEVVRAVAKNVHGIETAAYHFLDVWVEE